jgi:bacterioferritin-associated ferredoxin
VSVPFEIERGRVKKGDMVGVTDWEGADLGLAEVADIKDFKAENTMIIMVKAAPETADRIASIRLFDPEASLATPGAAAEMEDSTIICRCERVSLGEIRRAIRGGVRDLNQLKAVTRAGMGACGAKTCESLILSIFRSEGVEPDTVTGFSKRPLFVEVPLGAFANVKCRTEAEEKAGWSGF